MVFMTLVKSVYVITDIYKKHMKHLKENKLKMYTKLEWS